ncbi:MAG: thioredoxin SoxW [Rhodobacteraceae bacterium HLUCCA08]|nr:MAG: thioredoxin SoxW [Rhodobacteraceae bacterium HLUCCA08]
MLKRLMTILALVASAGAATAELGDDGLHRADWIRNTFLDLSEDLAEANAEGKRLMLIVEQSGCIYCAQMHEEVFPVPEIEALLTDRFFVVRLNMYGDLEVVDFDGTVLPEKDMVRSWSVNFTPTILFFPETVEDGQRAPQAAAAVMPGAFGRWTTFNMLNWVLEEGYAGDEGFQRYHARMLESQIGTE